MDLEGSASIIGAIAALIGATTSIVWGRKVAAAKEEIIRTKDAQIDALRLLQEETIRTKDAQIKTLEGLVEYHRELTPTKIREYLLSTKAQMEEIVENLEKKLASARALIAEKDKRIARLRTADEIKTAEVDNLEAEIDELKRERTRLTRQLQKYRRQEEAVTELETFIRVWDEREDEWHLEFKPRKVRVIGGESSSASSS